MRLGRFSLITPKESAYSFAEQRLHPQRGMERACRYYRQAKGVLAASQTSRDGNVELLNSSVEVRQLV